MADSAGPWSAVAAVLALVLGGGQSPAPRDQHPEPQHAGGFTVARLSVTADRHAWREEVRTCRARSSAKPAAVGWSDWRAEGTDGHTYAAGPGPRPAYPGRRVLAPGQCVTGWWSIPVPPAPDGLEEIEFAPGGGTPLITWATMR